MSFVLIDTHCHVHVSRIDGTDTAEAGCCNAGKQTETCTNIVSSEGRREARDDNALDELDEKSHGEGSGGGAESMTPPLSGVVHITMGIKEDDWLGAVRFAAAREVAADNLRRSGSGHNLELFHPEREGGSNRLASVPHYFRFGLGLHPWSAHARSEGWLRDLTALLERHPEALVGEIGLDKVARTPDTRRVEWDHQLEVFRMQMALAAELSRPVSVHCVKAYGKIVDFLRDAGEERSTSSRGSRAHGGNSGSENGSGKYGGGGGGASGDGGGDESPECEAEAERSPKGGRNSNRDGGSTEGSNMHRRLPPRIALHSFTGSVEVAKDITRHCRGKGGGVDVYFGFSAAVNMRGDRGMKRLIDVLRVVPDSRILIETDRQVPVAAADELLRVCGAIAEAKGISVAEAAALANRNAALFLGELR